MRIILKPMGLLLLLGTLTTLATLVYVLSQRVKATGTAAAVAAPSPQPALAETSKTGAVAPVSTGDFLYKDGVENGWATFGWAKDMDWGDTAHARGGTGSCIRVHPANFEAVYLHHAPFSTVGYDRVTFYLNGGEKGRQVLRATVVVNENRDTPVSLTLKPLSAGRWTPVTVRLKDFLADDRPNVTGFWIMNMGGKTADTFYIDDVRLLRTGEPEPTAAAE